MKNKFRTFFLLLAIFTFLTDFVLMYFFMDCIPGILFVVLLLLSCLFLLPNSIYCIQADQNPTPTDWRIFYSIIIVSALFLICIIIYVLYYFNFV